MELPIIDDFINISTNYKNKILSSNNRSNVINNNIFAQIYLEMYNDNKLGSLNDNLCDITYCLLNFNLNLGYYLEMLKWIKTNKSKYMYNNDNIIENIIISIINYDHVKLIRYIDTLCNYCLIEKKREHTLIQFDSIRNQYYFSNKYKIINWKLIIENIKQVDDLYNYLSNCNDHNLNQYIDILLNNSNNYDLNTIKKLITLFSDWKWKYERYSVVKNLNSWIQRLKNLDKINDLNNSLKQINNNETINSLIDLINEKKNKNKNNIIK